MTNPMPNKPDQSGVSGASDRRAKVRDLLFKAAGGITDMADKEIDELNEIYRNWFLELIDKETVEQVGGVRVMLKDYLVKRVDKQLRAQKEREA